MRRNGQGVEYEIGRVSFNVQVSWGHGRGRFDHPHHFFAAEKSRTVHRVQQEQYCRHHEHARPGKLTYSADLDCNHNDVMINNAYFQRRKNRERMLREL